MDLVFGVLIGLLISVVWMVRELRGPAHVEPRGYLPRPPAAPGTGGRTCAAGGGAAAVWAAPTPAASQAAATGCRGGLGPTAHARIAPNRGRARHAVGTSTTPPEGVSTASGARRP